MLSKWRKEATLSIKTESTVVYHWQSEKSDSLTAVRTWEARQKWKDQSLSWLAQEKRMLASGQEVEGNATTSFIEHLLHARACPKPLSCPFSLKPHKSPPM